MRETTDVEFKSDINSSSFLKTVSAYANFCTGVIIFGIDDSGTVVGLKNPTHACLDIENKINDCISPRPQYSLEINESQKTIVLHVKESPNKPYFYKGKAYRRSDSSTVEVDRIELGRLILAGENLTYDQLPSRNQKLTFETLSRKLCNILDISTINNDILKTLGLIKNETYNHAAALLADSNSYPGVDIVQFGSSINKMLDRSTTEKVSILTQFEKAIEKFKLHLCFEQIEGTERKTVEKIPQEAFREAIANALIHRTWDIEARIRISIFSDRVEIISPGGLPSGLSEEEYLSGRVSVLRNPILAEVFYRLGYIEKFGTGIFRIKEAYFTKLEKPRFEINKNSVTVILPILGSQSGISNEETFLLEKMSSGRRYSRKELDNLMGFEKTKTIRLLGSLINKGLVVAEGVNRARRYIRA